MLAVVYSAPTTVPRDQPLANLNKLPGAYGSLRTVGEKRTDSFPSRGFRSALVPLYSR